MKEILGKALCSTSEVMVDEELVDEDPGASCCSLDDTLKTASVNYNSFHTVKIVFTLYGPTTI